MSKIGKSTETENSSSLGLLYWGMIVKGNRVLFCSKIDCGEVTQFCERTKTTELYPSNRCIVNFISIKLL